MEIKGQDVDFENGSTLKSLCLVINRDVTPSRYSITLN